MDDQDVEMSSKSQQWVDDAFFIFLECWRGFGQRHEEVHLGHVWTAATSFGMPARGLSRGTLVF